MSLFLNLQKIPDITTTERQLVNYIITHPNTVADMSMEEFAQETFSSRSTILRFCNKCGFDGWRSLKTQLIIDLNLYLKEQAERNDILPITKEDTAAEIIDKVNSLSVLSLMETAKVNSATTLLGAARKLAQARRIYVYGAGYSNAIAQDFMMRMCALRFPVVTYGNAYEFKMKIKDATDKDVGILISYTGRSAEDFGGAFRVVEVRNGHQQFRKRAL